MRINTALLAALTLGAMGNPRIPYMPRMPKFKAPIGTTLRTRDSKGKTYAYDSAGTIHRIAPERPWHGKSERRQVIAARRNLRNAVA